jgi:hypothetical protein
MLRSSEVLSMLAGSLYDAAADPTFGTFLEQLAHDTRATSTALVMHDFDHALAQFQARGSSTPKQTVCYQEYYHAVDVWAQKGLAKPAGYVSPMSRSACFRK